TADWKREVATAAKIPAARLRVDYPEVIERITESRLAPISPRRCCPRARTIWTYLARWTLSKFCHGSSALSARSGASRRSDDYLGKPWYRASGASSPWCREKQQMRARRFSSQWSRRRVHGSRCGWVTGLPRCWPGVPRACFGPQTVSRLADERRV